MTNGRGWQGTLGDSGELEGIAGDSMEVSNDQQEQVLPSRVE